MSHGNIQWNIPIKGYAMRYPKGYTMEYSMEYPKGYAMEYLRIRQKESKPEFWKVGAQDVRSSWAIS